jgi:hypothetical protein
MTLNLISTSHCRVVGETEQHLCSRYVRRQTQFNRFRASFEPVDDLSFQSASRNHYHPVRKFGAGNAVQTRDPNLNAASCAPVGDVRIQAAPRNWYDSIVQFGAGEAIRTPDPYLGKVTCPHIAKDPR